MAIRSVILTKIAGTMEVVYISGTVNGVPVDATVMRADVAAQPTRILKMTLLGTALIDAFEDAKRQPLGGLLGPIDIDYLK